jgi:hypothetical protein
MQLIAVNGRAFSPTLLKEAIVAAQKGDGNTELLLRQDDLFRTVRIDYREGLRYPHLERVAGSRDRLSELLRPRT